MFEVTLEIFGRGFTPTMGYQIDVHAMGYLVLGRFGMYQVSVTLKSDLELTLSNTLIETLKGGSYV